MMLLVDILLDGLFAAMAAMGFGAISDPPLKAYRSLAILAAVGHALRFVLMTMCRLSLCLADDRLWSTLAGEADTDADHRPLDPSTPTDDPREVCVQYVFCADHVPPKSR